jgi:polygalacturonase
MKLFILFLALPALVCSVSGIAPPIDPPFQHWRGSGSVTARAGDGLVNVLDYGAVAGEDGDAYANMKAFNDAFDAMGAGDTLLVPEGDAFNVVGGILASGLRNATIQVDGVLNFVVDFDNWPLTDDGKKYQDGFVVTESIDVVFTSSTTALFDGNGRVWWDKMIAGTLPPNRDDSRPKLFHFIRCADVLIERLKLVNSPSWNMIADGVRFEIRNIEVETDREYQRELKEQKMVGGAAKDKIFEWVIDKASGLIPAWLLQPEDLNTDGIDPSGIDFYIHDVKIYNDDDSIAVKPSQRGSVGVDGTEYDCSQNMLMENMELVGFGASIGSVPPTTGRKCVDGITMRNVNMPGTGKGIYVKSNGNDCLDGKTSQLTNLLFENFTIADPFWYAIWIGPQQQHEPNSELGLDCALIFPLHNSQCPTQGCSDFENITLKDVTIINPKLSPGAILGNETNPMRNIVFDNVVVKQDSKILGKWPWKEDGLRGVGTYKSEFVGNGVCRGCHPVPDGFVEE